MYMMVENKKSTKYVSEDESSNIDLRQNSES